MSAITILVSVGLIALSAFFVAIEFALVAARRHRLEEAARASASARAALRSARELSLLLAGSQLGITLCTLGLGAVAKPALDAALEPLLSGWGLPVVTAGVLAFVLSLIIVTFLHLVVGEMAPKSWAIAHPERSATLLALPMRAFMWFTRPLLVALNALANRCLRAVGVAPVDELSGGRGPADLRELVEHSVTAGALDPRRRDQIVTALELDSRPLREIVRPIGEVSGVPAGATMEAIQAASRDGGHLRLIVSDGDGHPIGVVHVRDTLTRARPPPPTCSAPCPPSTPRPRSTRRCARCARAATTSPWCTTMTRCSGSSRCTICSTGCSPPRCTCDGHDLAELLGALGSEVESAVLLIDDGQWTSSRNAINPSHLPAPLLTMVQQGQAAHAPVSVACLPDSVLAAGSPLAHSRHAEPDALARRADDRLG